MFVPLIYDDSFGILMPDESCRVCGGLLISRSLCSECKKVIQRVCRICGVKTEEQFHYECLPLEAHAARSGMKTEFLILPNLAIRTKKSHQSRNVFLVFGVVCIFALGFAMEFPLSNFQWWTGEGETTKSTITTQDLSTQTLGQIRMEYENCLGSGNGKSMTLRCPTEIGMVYEAVLAMPKDLEAKFSNGVFNIRGISASENSDGSVVIRYHDDLYRTFFLGCPLTSSSCK